MRSAEARWPASCSRVEPSNVEVRGLVGVGIRPMPAGSRHSTGGMAMKHETENVRRLDGWRVVVCAMGLAACAGVDGDAELSEALLRYLERALT